MNTVSAIFDTQKDAERAQQRLGEIGIPTSDIRIINQTSAGGAKLEHHSFWDSIKEFFFHEEDKRVYSEGLRRGGYLLAARVSEEHVGAATRTLQDCNPVELEGRTAQWRAEGWQARQASTSPQQGVASKASQEEAIPVVREELKVGKREVDRGTVRICSRVVEEPVHQDVRLREERVEVERRRPVKDEASSRMRGDGLLQERTVEISEHAEEAVVAKEAQVTEEVVVKKFQGERTQGIDETVRHTEVDVDDTRQQQKPGLRRGANAPEERSRH